MKFRSSYFQDKHFTNSHLPSPITTSLAVFALASRALLCVIGSLKNFRIFLYVDMFLANFPRFCLHDNVFVPLPSVFGDIFSAWMATANDYFLSLSQKFPTVFCFHLVKNVYQSHGHFFVDKYVSVLLKCTLFWKILSTCGHWEGSTVNWVQPSPIITQAVGTFKIFYLREQSGKNRSFLFLMFCSVYTYIVCINVRFFFFLILLRILASISCCFSLVK